MNLRQLAGLTNNRSLSLSWKTKQLGIIIMCRKFGNKGLRAFFLRVP